jgi:Tfp pilus assembly PilM family ATPase
VEADGGARGLRVTRLGEREIATAEGVDREESIREAVDTLFKETHAGRDEAVLAWPAEGCTIRELDVPFRDPDQIRRVLKFEFESHLHAQAVEDVVLDFLPVGETREGARLLCFAAPKPALRARLEAAAKARVDPVAVDTDVTALAAAAAATGLLAELPTSVLVDLGSRSTKIVVLVEGRIRAARAFRGGMDALDADRSAAAPVEPGAAADPPAAPEPPPGGAATAEGTQLALAEDRRGEFLERVAREVSRTLAQAAPGVAFPAILLSGRGALLPGLREDLAARTGVEARLLDPFARVAHPVPAERVEEAGAVYATALGAAARGLGIGPASLDLRREDLAYARRFDQIKVPLAAALGFLLLGMGFLLWRARDEKAVAQQEFRTMLATLLRTSKAVEDDYRTQLTDEQAKKLYGGSGDELQTVQDSRRRVKQMHDHLKVEMGLSTDVPAIVSELDVFKAVEAAIKSVREQLDYCLVTSENYTQREVQIQIVLSAPEHVDILKKAFQEARGPDGRQLFPGQDGVVYTTVQPNKQGKYSVPFILKLEKIEKK